VQWLPLDVDGIDSSEMQSHFAVASHDSKHDSQRREE